MAAGVCCAGLSAVILSENLGTLGTLVRDPYVPILVLAGAVTGLLLGVRLVTRPGPGAVRASTVAGVVWLIAWGSLAVRTIGTAGELGPKVSSSLIGALGVAGALVAAVTQAPSGSNVTVSDEPA